MTGHTTPRTLAGPTTSATARPARRATHSAQAPATRTVGRGTTGRSPARPATRPLTGSTAQRFAARVRRRRQRRTAVAAGAVTLGLLVGWLVFGSTALAVQHITVEGVHRVPAGSVRAAVEFEIGRPMALVAPAGAARQVAALPLVASVRIVRSWPSTLVVRVTEREPIAAVPAGGGTVALVDGDGVVIETDARAPAGLPLLQVDVARSGAAALRAARQVFDELPATMRATVRQIGATSPDAVDLVLADGSRVTWGSADDAAEKLQALRAVHPRPLAHAVAIDVSSPETPAITG